MTGLDHILRDQDVLLADEQITSEPNRRGLRVRTGDLLEDAFIELAASLAPTLSVEIGAHEASFSERLKRKVPDLRSLAFDANPDVAKWFAPRVHGVEYRHLAISDHDGSAQLHIPRTRRTPRPKRRNQMSSLHHRQVGRFRSHSVVVPARRLDTVLADIARDSERRRIVMWVDAEGAQREIIAGGSEAFEATEAVYIELERTAYWDEQLLAEDVTTILAGIGLDMVMFDNLAVGQFNAVFVSRRADVLDRALLVARRYVEALRDVVMLPN